MTVDGCSSSERQKSYFLGLSELLELLELLDFMDFKLEITLAHSVLTMRSRNQPGVVRCTPLMSIFNVVFLSRAVSPRYPLELLDLLDLLDLLTGVGSGNVVN